MACLYYTRQWLTLKVMASQARMNPESLRRHCVEGSVKARRVAKGPWLVWADSDGLPVDSDKPIDLIQAEE